MKKKRKRKIKISLFLFWTKPQRAWIRIRIEIKGRIRIRIKCGYTTLERNENWQFCDYPTVTVIKSLEFIWIAIQTIQLKGYCMSTRLCNLYIITLPGYHDHPWRSRGYSPPGERCSWWAEASRLLRWSSSPGGVWVIQNLL